MTCAECYIKAQTPEELLEMIERDIKNERMAKNVSRLNDEYIKLTKHDLHRRILIKKNAICKITPAIYGDNGLRDIEGCTWIHLQNDRDYILVDEDFDTVCNMLDV